MYHHPPFGNGQVKAGFVSRRKAVTERRRQAGSAIGQEVIKPQPWLALSDLRDLYAAVAFTSVCHRDRLLLLSSRPPGIPMAGPQKGQRPFCGGDRPR